MKTFNNYVKKYLNNTDRKDLKFYFKKDNSNNILLCDCFSIIELFNNEKINEMELTEGHYLMNQQINNMYKNFIKDDFNIECDYITTSDNNYITFDKKEKITYDRQKINKILNIIGVSKYFKSEKNKNAICITGKNGIAFLLGCKTY